MRGRIAIIDYGAGNVTSVGRALAHLGASWEITSDPAAVLAADRVIFPGVGAAPSAMANLRRLGLADPIREVVAAGTPFLGICLGAQIIFEASDEGPCDCLGLLAGRVVSFPRNLAWNGQRLKVPHMGWNAVKALRPHPVLEGVAPADRFYFVHSYFPIPADRAMVLAQTDYGVDFPSVVGAANLIACQFHAEKSGKAGLRLLASFLRWGGGPHRSGGGPDAG